MAARLLAGCCGSAATCAPAPPLTARAALLRDGVALALGAAGIAAHKLAVAAAGRRPRLAHAAALAAAGLVHRAAGAADAGGAVGAALGAAHAGRRAAVAAVAALPRLAALDAAADAAGARCVQGGWGRGGGKGPVGLAAPSVMAAKAVKPTSHAAGRRANRIKVCCSTRAACTHGLRWGRGPSGSG